MFESLLAYEYYLASAQLALAMVGMGATLHVRDFLAIARTPTSFVVGYLSVLLLSPFIALGLTRVIPLEAGIAVGLLLIAAVPGGTMSNLLAYFARSNVALSVALTAAATVTCLVSTPLVLNAFAGHLLPGQVVMPARAIAFDIFVALLLPLAAGMALGARFDEHRQRIAKVSIRASLLTILGLVVISAGSGRVEAGQYGLISIAAMIALGLSLFVASVSIARVAGFAHRDVVTIGLETCFRNGNLAVLIKATVFPAIPGTPDPFADQVFFVALLYGMVGTAIAVPVTVANRVWFVESAESP